MDINAHRARKKLEAEAAAAAAARAEALSNIARTDMNNAPDATDARVQGLGDQVHQPVGWQDNVTGKFQALALGSSSATDPIYNVDFPRLGGAQSYRVPQRRAADATAADKKGEGEKVQKAFAEQVRGEQLEGAVAISARGLALEEPSGTFALTPRMNNDTLDPHSGSNDTQFSGSIPTLLRPFAPHRSDSLRLAGAGEPSTVPQRAIPVGDEIFQDADISTNFAEQIRLQHLDMIRRKMNEDAILGNRTGSPPKISASDSTLQVDDTIAKRQLHQQPLTHAFLLELKATKQWFDALGERERMHTLRVLNPHALAQASVREQANAALPAARTADTRKNTDA